MSTFDVVLHPTDFSPEDDEAFQLACNIARDHFASLVVVHVMPPATNLDEESESVDENDPLVCKCHEHFQRMRRLAVDIPITFRLVAGYPVGMILNVAHEQGADLIVIASEHHHRNHFQLHGSIADGVLRQAHCPVCCLRQPSSKYQEVRDEAAAGTN